MDESFLLKKQLTLSPNPTSGLVRIAGANAAEVQVYNTLGQLLKTVRSTNEISLEGLPQGVYTLRIADEKGRFTSTRKSRSGGRCPAG
jgi:hypothetical protein